MDLIGKVFLLIAALSLALAGVLTWDTYVMITEGKETTAEITRIETRIQKSSSSSSNTTRSRIIHLEYPGPGGKIFKGTLGHRFSSKPQPRKPGDPAMQLNFRTGVALPSFTEHNRGDRFKAVYHPDNPYFLTDKRDFWILPGLLGGVGAIFLVIGLLCLAMPAPQDPLDTIQN